MVHFRWRWAGPRPPWAYAAILIFLSWTPLRSQAICTADGLAGAFCPFPIRTFRAPHQTAAHLFIGDRHYTYEVVNGRMTCTQDRPIPPSPFKRPCTTGFTVTEAGNLFCSGASGAFQFQQRWVAISPPPPAEDGGTFAHHQPPFDRLSDGTFVRVGTKNALLVRTDASQKQILTSIPYPAAGKNIRSSFLNAITADLDGRYFAYFPNSGRLFTLDYGKNALDEVMEVPWMVLDADEDHASRPDTLKPVRGQTYQPPWPLSCYFLPGPEGGAILMARFQPSAGRGNSWFAFTIPAGTRRLQNSGEFPQDTACVWMGPDGQLGPWLRPSRVPAAP
jgi:hypothetical protein